MYQAKLLLYEVMKTREQSQKRQNNTHIHTYTHSTDPSCTRKSCWYKEAWKTREQNYFYNFDSMSPVLLFAYGTKKHAPLPEIHLYDLEALQNLAFQYLSDFISYFPSLTPVFIHPDLLTVSSIIWDRLPPKSCVFFFFLYMAYPSISQLPSLLSHFYQIFIKNSLS